MKVETVTINEIVWGKCLGTERENGKHKILSKCGVSKGPREEEAKKKKNELKVALLIYHYSRIPTSL